MSFFFLLINITGKTTVARLFAKILHDTKMRKSSTFVESTAQTLKDKGVGTFRWMVQQAENGVLFIDEAYVLAPAFDAKGKSITVELMNFAENHREKYTFVVAGPQKDMTEMFFSFNSGLKSRFEEIFFDDFSAGELRIVWEGMLKKDGWTCDGGVSDVVVRRLETKIGRGFGNAREVRKVFEVARDVAVGRDDFEEENMELIIEDVLGYRPSLKDGKLKELVDEVVFVCF